jgi:hypothetical protein
MRYRWREGDFSAWSPWIEPKEVRSYQDRVMGLTGPPRVAIDGRIFTERYQIELELTDADGPHRERIL